jgi:uncharacterized membrane protein YraQ (UPF0718 family)
MLYSYIGTGLAVAFSLLASRHKTLKALRIALKRFITIAPVFLTMLIFVLIALFLVPDKVISRYLGTENAFLAVLLASFLGSITIMPGFIVFPLCGILSKKGVLYMVLSAFSSTLTMVGVLTYPIEREYLGRKVTVMRNMISFFIALAVAMMTGIFFGELFS